MKRFVTVVIAALMLTALLCVTEYTAECDAIDVYGQEHVHGSWVYTADGAVLTATCGNDGCTDRPFTASITINAYSKLYDGKSYNGAEIEITDDWKEADLSIPNIQYYVENTTTSVDEAPTAAGMYKAKITLAGATASCDFTISPRTLTVIGTSADGKTYDGTIDAVAHIGEVNGIIGDDDIIVTVKEAAFINEDVENGKQVIVSYDVTGAKAGNYIVEDSVTCADIEKRGVTITSGSAVREYNGIPLTNNEVTDTLTGSESEKGFVNGEGATYNVTGSQTKVGTAKNTFTYTLNAGTNADNYNITTVEGDITVNKVSTPIVITASSDTKTYDGTALMNSGYTYTDNVLADGDVMTVTVAGGIIDAGTASNVVVSYKVMRGEDDVTDCYTFGASVDGTLTVNKRNVILTSGSSAREYDGTSLTNKEVTVSGDGFVFSDDAIYSVTGCRTKVGTSKNTFTYTLNAGTNADNYNITTVEGDITVNKVSAPIVITATSDTKLFDGKVLMNHGYTYTDNVLADGDVMTATVAGGIIDAGTASNVVVSYKVMHGDDDVTDCYTFGACEDGTLTVNKRNVTITSGSVVREYNGTPLTNNEVTDTLTGSESEKGFVNGEGATYNVTGSQTKVGTAKNTFTYTLNAGTNADNYNITTVEGELTVDKVSEEIVITAASDEKTYDGTALSNCGYTYTENVLADGDVLTATAEGSIINAGTAVNVIASYKVMHGDDDVTDCYTFRACVDGTLTVNKRSVILTSGSGTKTYDGKPLTNSNMDVSGDGFASGEGAVYTVSGSQTKVGSSTNTFTFELNSNTIRNNYSISKVEGVLTVTEKPAQQPAPITEKTIVVPVGEEDNDIALVKGKVVDNKAIISNFTPETLNKITSSKNATGVTNIDCSDTGSIISKVELKTANIKALAESALTSVKVMMNSGTMALDYEALTAVVNEAKGEAVTFVLEEIGNKRLNADQKNAVKSEIASNKYSNVIAVIDSYILSDTSKIKDLGNGKATLEINSENFSSGSVEIVKTGNIIVCEIAEDGTITVTEFEIVDGMIVFEVNRLSQYVVLAK